MSTLAATTASAAATHGDSLAGRLVEHAPEHYGDIMADAISAQLRALGVSSVNVKWDGQVLKGAKADDIQAAMTRRASNGA